MFVVVQEPGAATEEVDVVGDAEDLQTIGKSEHNLSIWLIEDDTSCMHILPV